MACLQDSPSRSLFFFFNDTATTEIYTLSLHDALPISLPLPPEPGANRALGGVRPAHADRVRSEEHTSELQSRLHLVCRLLLEKKNKRNEMYTRSQHIPKRSCGQQLLVNITTDEVYPPE